MPSICRATGSIQGSWAGYGFLAGAAIGILAGLAVGKNDSRSSFDLTPTKEQAAVGGALFGGALGAIIGLLISPLSPSDQTLECGIPESTDSSG